MTDLKDTQKYQGLMSAVKDIMMNNQNLYQNDREEQFYKNAPEDLRPKEAPEVPEVEAQATPEVEVPDPAPTPTEVEAPDTPEE